MMNLTRVLCMLMTAAWLASHVNAAQVSQENGKLGFAGDQLIDGHQHKVGQDGRPWTQDLFDPDCSLSTVGGRLSIRIRRSSPGSDGAALRVPIKDASGGDGLAHTLDVTAARPGNYWDDMPASGRGVGWSVSIPVDSAYSKRYTVFLGDAGQASDWSIVDQITVAVQGGDKYAPPTMHKVCVAGLNIERMNRYRAAMNDAGELRIYLNDQAEPVFTEAKVPSVADAGHDASFGLMAPRSGHDRYGFTQFRLDIDQVEIHTRAGTFEAPGALARQSVAPVEKVADGVLLARDGRPAFQIVIAKNAAPHERFAAAELADFLGRVIGSHVELTNEAADGTNIFVGRRPDVEKLLPDVKWDNLGVDGVVIQSVGDDLLICGPQPPGTIYAVYTFLEEVVGCRWWSPDSQSIPSKPTLIIPTQRVAYRPPFDMRDIRTSPMIDKLFTWRMRQNGKFLGWDTGDHSLPWLLPAKEHFVAHPDWFMYMPEDGDKSNKYSYVNGLQYVKETRPPEWYPVAEKNRRLPWQHCLTQPEARKAIIAAALKHTDEMYPSFAPWGPKVIWVSQADGGWQCLCDNCKAVIEREGSESASWIEICNAVAEQAARKHPDVLIATLVYLHTQTPPKTIKAHPNVVAYPAFLDRNMRIPIGELGTQSDNLRGWCSNASHVYVWDYDTNFRNWITPYPQYFTTPQSLRFYRDVGVKGAMIESTASSDAEFQAMRAYVVAHVMWNPDLDTRAVMKEFLDGYYGPAGPHLMECIETFTKAANRKADFWLSCYASSTEGWLTLADMNAATQQFDQAATAVASDPTFSARVRRARSAIDLVWVLRYEQLKAEAKEKKMEFLGPKDPAAAREPFVKNEFTFETYGQKRVYSDLAAELASMKFEKGDDSDFQIRGTD